MMRQTDRQRVRQTDIDRHIPYLFIKPFPFQMPKIEPTAKFIPITLEPSRGSNPTEYMPPSARETSVGVSSEQAFNVWRHIGIAHVSIKGK